LAAPTATEYVERFSAAERLAHWVAATTFLVMMATGLILYLPAFASLAADRVLWKSLHVGAAIGFWAGLVAVVAASPRGLARTAAQLDRFDDDDRAWLAWAVRRRGAEPPAGRFNAGQKLNSAVIAGLAVVFTASGVLILLQESDAAFRGATSAILVHDWATWLAVPLVAGHVYLATLNASTRHSFRGITLGTVRRDWARRHHPKWEAECE
jgi:formate dehydrogenase subunit gamma